MKQTPRSNREFAAVVVIALALLACYANAWDTAFLFDDEASILHNPSVLSNALVQSLIEPNAGLPLGATVSTRPVASFSFAFNHWISGMSPAGFRAGNLLIHFAAAWILLLILRHAFERSGDKAIRRDAFGLATAIALIWAVHPLHTSVVTYTVQRVESLMGLFYLATWLCFIRASEARNRSGKNGSLWASAAIACCLAGMAAKEVMVSAPLTILLYDRVFVSNSFEEVWRRHGRWHLGLFACWALLALVVLRFSLANEAVGEYVDLTWQGYFLSQGYFISRYVFLAFWPMPLAFDYGFTPIGDPFWIASGILLVASWGALTLWAWRRNMKVAFLGYFFFAILAPSSSVILIGTEIAAEHRMHLASIVPICCALLGIHHWITRSGTSKAKPGALPIPILAIVAVVVAGLGLRTFDRNRLFADPQLLWEDTVAKVPGNARALAELARLYGEDARRERDPSRWQVLMHKAAETANRAIEADPGYGQAYTARGRLRLAGGDADGALEDLATAIKIFPGEAGAYRSRGQVLHQSDPIAAEADYTMALQLRPSGVMAAINRAALRMSMGKVELALEDYEHVLRYRPDHAMAWSNRGIVMEQLGRYSEALASREQSLIYYRKLDFQQGVEEERAAVARLKAVVRSSE